MSECLGGTRDPAGDLTDPSEEHGCCGHVEKVHGRGQGIEGAGSIPALGTGLPVVSEEEVMLHGRHRQGWLVMREGTGTG